MSLVQNDKGEPSFFSELATLMDDGAFKDFYDKYMNTTLEMKSTILYIELYQNIEKFYSQLTGQKIPKKYMTDILKECIRRKSYRKPLTTVIESYFKSEVTRDQLNQCIENIFRANTKGLDFVGKLILEDQ